MMTMILRRNMMTNSGQTLKAGTKVLVSATDQSRVFGESGPAWIPLDRALGHFVLLPGIQEMKQDITG